MNLYRFTWNNTDNTISSLFIAEEAEIDALIGQQAHFGELLNSSALGQGIFEEEHFENMCVSQATVNELLRAFGTSTLFGADPRKYLA